MPSKRGRIRQPSITITPKRKGLIMDKDATWVKTEEGPKGHETGKSPPPDIARKIVGPRKEKKPQEETPSDDD